MDFFIKQLLSSLDTELIIKIKDALIILPLLNENNQLKYKIFSNINSREYLIQAIYDSQKELKIFENEDELKLYIVNSLISLEKQFEQQEKKP